MIRVTLTGIDDGTDLDKLQDMRRYSLDEFLEFGILVSAKVGRNRYPHFEWVERAVKKMPRCCALHICGSEARIRLKCGFYDDAIPFVKRIQLNGSVTGRELFDLLERYPHLDIITQFGFTDPDLLAAPFNKNAHQILMDGSGGRGILPGCWSAPDTKKNVGFAGGLGPENLAIQLPLIKAVSSPGWWIDMESGIRNEHDEFDFDKAQAVVDFARAQAP